MTLKSNSFCCWRSLLNFSKVIECPKCLGVSIRYPYCRHPSLPQGLLFYIHAAKANDQSCYSLRGLNQCPLKHLFPFQGSISFFFKEYILCPSSPFQSMFLVSSSHIAFFTRRISILTHCLLQAHQQSNIGSSWSGRGHRKDPAWFARAFSSLLLLYSHLASFWRIFNQRNFTSPACSLQAWSVRPVIRQETFFKRDQCP